MKSQGEGCTCHEEFLEFAKLHRCRLVRTGRAGRTARIYFGDHNLGYVNATVKRRRACYGYRFRFDRPNGAAPTGAEEQFRRRYGNMPGLDWHQGTGTNSHRTFLCISDMQAAKNVLLEDIASLSN